MPAIISSAIHTVQKIDRLAEIGLQHQQRRRPVAVIAPVISTVGSSLSFACSDSSHAVDDDEQGLQEFGRLELREADSRSSAARR